MLVPTRFARVEPSTGNRRHIYPRHRLRVGCWLTSKQDGLRCAEGNAPEGDQDVVVAAVESVADTLGAWPSTCWSTHWSLTTSSGAPLFATNTSASPGRRRGAVSCCSPAL